MKLKLIKFGIYLFYPLFIVIALLLWVGTLTDEEWENIMCAK